MAADAKLTVSASLLKSTAPATPAPVRGMMQTELKREAGVQSTPRALTRGQEPQRRPVAAASVATPAPVEQRRAADLDFDKVSRRSLHGAELSGEIADRPVLSHALPVYPEWATTQAVEGRVTLYFEVLPDGRIKENVQVRKTAGFADFDQNAMAALRQWRFAPLPDGATADQWGTITFRYRLRD
jgi:TonB family protein